MKYLPLLVVGLLAAPGLANPAFADEINASVQPLPNATVTLVKVDLSCTVQPDASLNDCHLADGAKASKHDEETAINWINGTGHMNGAFVAGSRTKITVRLPVSKSSSLVLLR